MLDSGVVERSRACPTIRGWRSSSRPPRRCWRRHGRPDFGWCGPPDDDSWDTQRFFGDWLGAAFLTQIATAELHGPRYIAGDWQRGLVVLEDLGEHQSLVQPLLDGDAADAEAALLAFARRLGRMHADSLGHADTFDRLVDDLGAPDSFRVAQSCRWEVDQLGERSAAFRALLAQLDLPVTPELDGELDRIGATLADPGPFLAYIHHDPCPDNMFYRDGDMRLIDFEFSRFGHALIDATYGRVPFPTCWCANRMPDDVVARMERPYRAELGRTCAAARDDDLYLRAVAEVCGGWVVGHLSRLLETTLDRDETWGIASVRARVLTRLESFIDVARQADDLPVLRDTATRLRAVLSRRWPDAAPLPVYPAFRR